MKKKYTDFICEKICVVPEGIPIYTRQLAEKIAVAYQLSKREASVATAVAVKRVMDKGVIPELRCYKKGVYYRTAATPFGEIGINKEQLIADKYLLPDIGYETGLTVLYKIGLISQMPRERILATNVAKGCMRTDRKLDVIIRPPKTIITAKNKDYLQVLDMLELVEKAPIDEKHPFEVLADYIQKKELQYIILLALADRYYNYRTLLCLAHTANKGELSI